MRNAFVSTLEIFAGDFPIFLLTADLGYTVFETFAERFPERFINVGVAEANMIGIAAGLASCGKLPFVYSIATFATMRPFEQIRNDVCFQNRSVAIVGVGAGFAYGSAGMTHHAIEDLSIMRSLPNMTVISPADPVELNLAIKAILKQPCPVYLRLSKAGEPNIHSKTDVNFEIGKGIVVREGNDIAIIATGTMVGEALKSAEILARKGVDCQVISMHTIKPIDRGLIVKVATLVKNVVTLEEHNVIGGLGSAVAEILSESSIRGLKFKRIGIPDTFCHIAGEVNYLRSRYLLSPDRIVKTIENSVLA